MKYIKNESLPASSSTSTSVNSRHKYINPKAVPNPVSKNTYTKSPVVTRNTLTKQPAVMMSKHKLIRNITDNKRPFLKDNVNVSQKSMNQYQNVSSSTFKLKPAPPQNSTTIVTRQVPNKFFSQQIPKTKLIKKYSVVNINKNNQNNERLRAARKDTTSFNSEYNIHTSTAAMKTLKYSKHNKWHKPSYIPSKKIPILRRSRFMLIKKTTQPLIVSFLRKQNF